MMSSGDIFQLHMHIGDSVESIADSYLEDEKLQKLLISPLFAQRASGKRDATLWIAEFQAYPSQRFKSRMNKNDKQSPS